VIGIGRRSACLLLLAAGCASRPPLGPHGLPEKIFDLPSGSCTARPSAAEAGEKMTRLTAAIGHYPPTYKDEADRESIYAEWSALLLCAEALPAGRHAEDRFALLAELYRQGHNLDVRGAGERAASNLQECLVEFPDSVTCNLTASYFYLSVEPTPEHIAIAERSLTVLREQALPGYSDDAEAGFVFLFLYRRDEEGARAQIARYLELFPNGARAGDFRKMRDHLGGGIRVREW